MDESIKSIALKYLEVTAKAAGFPEPKTVGEIIGALIGTVLSFLGIIFLILVLYGGFVWMTSMGNEYKVQKAKDILTQAVIGVIIVVSAYAITFFVFSALQNTLQ